MPLSDAAVRQAKATGKSYTLPDFDGLSLAVTANGGRTWHYRYYWHGKQKRMSLGTYPEITLREARALRDEARALLAKGINPRAERKRKRAAIRFAGENTFKLVYEKWFAHRQRSLKQGRHTSRSMIPRIFEKDVFPKLGERSIYEIKRPDILEVIEKIEKRGALSIAEKVRTWLNQLFRWALVKVPGLEINPASDLDVVAEPLPPVNHNPFLRMHELPKLLQRVRKYRGRLRTQLGIRLLFLTGVRTGELRLATPDQFHLDKGLWIIPPEVVKQLQLDMRRKRQRPQDIPPYIVPLSIQAMEIVRYFLEQFKPGQRYLIPHDWDIEGQMSENTLNNALKRMGYRDLLTGHGIRATMSTALNEIGYPLKWVDAQLSHVDPNKTSATYNHAEYVEQRRRMMQDWADRLDLFEQDQVAVATMPLTIQFEDVTIAPQRPQATNESVSAAPAATPILLVAPTEQSMPTVAPATQRLSAVEMPEYAQPKLSDLQRERLKLLEIFEGPDNLVVADYAKLAGKSRRWITYEIQAGNLLSIQLGNKGRRVPVWQLDPLKRQLVQAILRQTPRGVDTWDIYHALLRPHDALGSRPPIDAVTPENMKIAVRVVVQQRSQREEPLAPMPYPIQVRQSVQQLVENAIAAGPAMPMVSD